jgi:hypothetical protein
MGQYDRYVTKRVTLADVLDALDEKLHTMTRSVFRKEERSEDQLINLVGRVQGLEEAIKQLEYQFGDKGSVVPE